MLTLELWADMRHLIKILVRAESTVLAASRTSRILEASHLVFFLLEDMSTSLTTELDEWDRTRFAVYANLLGRKSDRQIEEASDFIPRWPS